jgi:DMSO/TMAO reductase YedYZ heme-binding membrane subunit
MEFFKFFIRYVASKLAVPFWVVGHIHLTMNVYDDIKEILMSLGINILVLLAFWYEWTEERNKKNKIKN